MPKKQIDELLDEIKGGNDQKDYFTNKYGMDKGSFDTADPTTTNLYIGNLAAHTTGKDTLMYFLDQGNYVHCYLTEEDLTDLFGQYGRLQSVKVMWPRSEEERARKRNCGFVNFQYRSDAQEALVSDWYWYWYWYCIPLNNILLLVTRQ